jgi:hypothetical protein
MPRKYRGTAIPAKEKDKQAMTSNAAYRVEAKNGGSMNHQQLTGWGDVRTDVKKFGKK